MKVWSLANNSLRLCGGFFVLNEHGNAVTLGFCSGVYHKNYGITVAHLADSVNADGNVVHVGEVGDKLYAFDADELDASGVALGREFSLSAEGKTPRFQKRPLQFLPHRDRTVRCQHFLLL